MKNKLFLVLMLMSLMGLAQNVDNKNLHNVADMERKAHSWIGRTLSLVPDNYDLKYHRCRWNVDPNINYISGSVTSYFVSKVVALLEIDFDLSDSMTVDSVLHQGAIVPFTHTGNLLQITLPMALHPGMLDSVSVYYQGAPFSSGFGSFQTDIHAAVPVIWTLSEPFGALDWWPCKQSLNDKIDSIDIIVKTPLAYRAASNGVLISEIQNGVSKVYHWQSHYPIAAYLIAIGVTNYAVYSNYLPLNLTDTLQILNYVYPEDSTYAAGLTPDILSVIALYDSLFITYPFAHEKYGHCEFGWGGGEEHQTMSFVTDFYHELIAHECAHQWFGDYITCGSWEDVWLNEGFATYLEAITEQFLLPATNWDTWKSSTLNDVTSQPSGSVLCSDTTDFNRIFDGRLTYNKGAWVLHMLRWKMGDTLFFQSLKNYLNDSTLAFSYAKTPDLKHHLETTSGQNLTTFFSQWYYHEGFPSYQVEWNADGTSLLVKISQTQSDTSVTFFEMPVPIQFQAAGHDTTLVFNHTFSGQLFNIPLNFIPTTITFDPQLWILSNGNSVTYNSILINEQVSADEPTINVYPNPVHNKLSINANKLAGNSEITLKNIVGESEIKIEKYFDGGNDHFDFDVSHLSSGIYFLTMNAGKQMFVRKIVKE